MSHAFKHPTQALALLLGACFSSCLSPGGETVEEQRASALEMREEALAAFYADEPELEAKVGRAAGHAVFSNFSVHPGLLSFASGYGVVTNKATGRESHSKWTRLTLGPGIAVKGLYGIALFDDADTVKRFEEGPWMAGGQIEASLVFGDFGGALEQAWAFNRGVEVHYLTHTGVALELELIGIGKVSSNSKLNRAAAP